MTDEDKVRANISRYMRHKRFTVYDYKELNRIIDTNSEDSEFMITVRNLWQKANIEKTCYDGIKIRYTTFLAMMSDYL